MKIVNIVPGFGGSFYCGNCLRDGVFVKNLRVLGHDSVLIPIYLPLTYDKNDNNIDIPVFYGAVNIYLKQNFRFLRNMPSWLQNLFNSKPILKFAAHKAGSTRATGLEEMTISMLKGTEGFQAEELNQLIDYLKYNEKPDIIHLSNSLLLGLAKKIREDINIPVVCSLQDEDVWIDGMQPHYRDGLWELMAEKGNDVNAFVSVSNYFGEVMKNKLHIPDNKLHIIHIGINPDQYEVVRPSLEPPVIGYLSRMCEDNGLGILVDAFIELKDNSVFKNSKLRLYGGMTADDKNFLNKQIKKLKRKGYYKDVELNEYYTTNNLPEFFSGLSVLSVPVLKGEAFGLYQIESMASGIPVVQPALGGFTEIIENTGGGITYHPNTAASLASALNELFSHPEQLQKMSTDGRNTVIIKYNSDILTKQMVEVYNKVLQDS
jgi:glycosyltransferase involved in cell wall biosynthesis